MNSKSKSTLRLTIERPAYGDVSICRHGGKVVFVDGTFISGESVEAEIEKEKKDYISASVLKIIESSPERVSPGCRYFGDCGGCHLQHIPYDLQMKLKENILTDCLIRIGKIDIALSAPLVGDSPWNYRFRGQFKVSGGQTGFYRKKTRDVVDISDCPLMTPEISGRYQSARQIIRSNKMIRDLQIISGDTVVASVGLSDNKGPALDMEKLAVQFIDSGFSGLIMNYENGDNFGYGKISSTMDLLGSQYIVSPTCFFQSNWNLNVRLVKHIKEELSPLSGMEILDLFAGSGNFSLPLSEANRVIAVEENKSAIENGKRSSQINGLENITFIRSSAENYAADDRADIVIVDPSRTGLKIKVINKILSIMPEKIVYVSCNPTTLARDLKHLTEKYDVRSVRLVDFFPQTYHIETLVFLSIK